MEIFGYILALTCSISHSLKGMFQKMSLKEIDSNTLIFVLSLLSTLFWSPFIYYYGIPDISGKLLVVFLIGSILFYIGKLFHFKAMQIEDISYIAPLMGMVTVGVVFMGIVFLEEYPNIYGIIGIIMILLSVYYLNIQKYHTKFFEPITHIFSNKGSQLFLITIFCYSATNILDKIGVQESYPIFWIFLMNLSLLIISSFGLRKTIQKDICLLKKHYVLLGTDPQKVECKKNTFYFFGYLNKMRKSI